MKKIIQSLFIFCLLLGCKSEKSKEGPHLSDNEIKSSPAYVQNDWQDLLSKENINGWRGFNEEGGLPAGWVMEGETLKSLGQGADIGGDIIYGKEEFEEFELSLE